MISTRPGLRNVSDNPWFSAIDFNKLALKNGKWRTTGRRLVRHIGC
jgi:hypothetical protein